MIGPSDRGRCGALASWAAARVVGREWGRGRAGARTCWAERDEGRAGPAEEKEEQAELGRGERVGRMGLICWVGFGFPIGFLFSFSFLFYF